MRYRLRDDFVKLVETNLIEWDPMRTFRQGLVGVSLQTIALHLWLSRVVPWLTVSPSLIPNPRWNKFATMSLRVIAHTTFLMPYMQGVMYFGIGALSTLSIAGGRKNFDANFRDGYALAWMFWPFIMMSMYLHVPPQYGNLYMDMWNVFWAAAVSYVANRDESSDVISWYKVYMWLKARLALAYQPQYGQPK